MKKMAFRSALSALLSLVLSVPAMAQYTAKEQKSIDKSKEYYQQGKYEKAVTTIKKVQANNHYGDDDIWTLVCIYEYNRYQAQFALDIAKIIKKAGNSGAVTINSDKMKSSQYYSELINDCCVATLFCGKQEFASAVLHEQLIQPSVDTTISDEAKEIYGKGNEEYNNDSYTAAIRQYEKALRMDSTYYKATYKIGRCYFKDEKYEKAIPYYQKAIRLQPEMLDPREDLVTCYMKLKQWQDAYNACIDGIIAYPAVTYFANLDEICDKLGKTFNRHWMVRTSYPNVVSATGQMLVSEEPWSYYREAKNKIIDNCDDDGIVTKKSSLTDSKYMEVYSWEYMLKKSETEDKEFAFARKMKDEGFLDCFVMVSMYHISFRKQYADFSKNNAERIRKYIDTYLVK
jgi:tetratricopeptide (TPR) repeat protein